MTTPLPAPTPAPESREVLPLPPSGRSDVAGAGAPRRASGPAHIVLRRAVLVAAVAAVGIVHVWSHTRVTAAGYRLGELQRTQEALRAQRDRLEVEVATLRAPGRLEEFARTRLKMALPAPGAVMSGRLGATGSDRAGAAGGPPGIESLREPVLVTARAR